MLYKTRQILREEKSLYASKVDLLIRAYDHILWRIGKKRPMPLRGRICKVKIRHLKAPLLARIGTTDFFTISEIFMDGDYNPLLGIPRPSVKTILDLGANVGYSIRFWLENFPGSKILAVEPDPGNLRMCQRNIDLAGCQERVLLTQACVLSEPGTATLDIGGPGESGFTIATDPAKAKKAIAVRAVTVQELINGLPSDAPIDLLKCDIEGSEEAVFKTSSPWIKRVMLAVVETHSPYTVEQLLSDIALAGGNFEVLGRLDKSIGFASLVFLRNKLAPIVPQQ